MQRPGSCCKDRQNSRLSRACGAEALESRSRAGNSFGEQCGCRRLGQVIERTRDAAETDEVGQIEASMDDVASVREGGEKNEQLQ